MDRRSKEAERRKRILDHAKTNGNVAKTCRYFGVARASFYRWRQEYQKHGDPGLIPKTTGPKSHPNQTPAAVVDQVSPAADLSFGADADRLVPRPLS